MARYNLDLDNMGYASDVLSYFLWGQERQPSAEGISYAMLSGSELGKALLEDKENFLELYERNAKYLKKNIDSKMRKYPIMYNQTIRKMVFKLGVGAIEVKRS